jgi:hypothetical protein
MSPGQRQMLETWGYPYVLDEFRFHLTVTDRIPPDRQPAVRDTLTDWFTESLGESIVLDAVALFVEPEPGAPFELHSAHRLRAPDDRSPFDSLSEREGTR